VADIDKVNGKFQARWRDPDGRQRTKLFPTKREAQDHLAEVRTARVKGTQFESRAGQIRVGPYAVQWLRTMRHLRPNSVELYSSHVRNWIIPELGDRRLAAVTRGQCKLFVATLDARLAPSTVATVYAVLSRMMAHAVDEGRIPANPCLRVPLPRREQRVVVPLEPQAVASLARSITPRYELTIWLAAGAGLREGEALGLITSRVDFLRRRVHVLEQLQHRELSPLKTRASRRVVPVDDFVLQKVAAHIERWPGELLVTNRLGKPVQRNSFGHCWREVVAAADLPAGIRFHDLRHFYASSLIAAGLHPKVIQQRLGHANISETMDTYGHLFPDADEAGRDAIDAMFGQAGERRAEAVSPQVR
jgi:integrase